MNRRLMSFAAGMVACVLLAAPVTHATTVLSFNLEQMTNRADRIFRGTVLDVEEHLVAIGGGQLPTLTYRIRVAESLKGQLNVNANKSIVEIRMLGTIKQYNANRPAIPLYPQLRVGEDYLLLFGPESSTGLSTPIGLGQGAFRVFLAGNSKQELAENQNGNSNLYRGMSNSGTRIGQALTYDALRSDIQSQLGY